MKRTIVVLALYTVFFAHCSSAVAQQPTKTPRIGLLFAASPSVVAARTGAFRQGLRELGYVEGKNIIIEYQPEEKLDRLPAVAAKLVRSKVDVIVTGGATNTRAAKEATMTIPIVMAQDPDPVGNGFVASLARPGGNITGLSSQTAELSGKRLDLLKEILPKVSRVIVLGTSTNTGNAQQLRETELAAGVFGVKLQYLDILGPKDIEIAFPAPRTGRADAVLVLNSSITNSHQTEIAKFAVKNRLPAIFSRAEAVETGGL